MTASIANATPAEAEFRCEAATPSLASVADAAPAEPDDEPSGPTTPDEPQHIPPKLTPLKEHVTSRGRYLWETCEFRDEYTGKAYRTLRFTSERNEKRPLSITMGPHICWTALDATFEFLADGLPPEEASDARVLYRCLMRAMTAPRAAAAAPQETPLSPVRARAAAEAAPSRRGRVDPARMMPR